MLTEKNIFINRKNVMFKNRQLTNYNDSG